MTVTVPVEAKNPVICEVMEAAIDTDQNIRSHANPMAMTSDPISHCAATTIFEISALKNHAPTSMVKHRKE